MNRLEKTLRFWDPKAPLQTKSTHELEHSTVVCSDETIDYAAYHLSAYDSILGVLLFVGDNAPAIVIARGRRWVAMPVQKGVHWLDCHIFAGTSNFLLLAPNILVLANYMRHGSSTALFPQDRNVALFSCLHVPQGMVWGAVGCRDGSIEYWKLKYSNEKESLVWAALRTDLREFSRLLMSPQKAAPCGRVHAIDSYPASPNALIAVSFGVSGVFKWFIDENHLNTYFVATGITTSHGLSTCRVTPGGAYVVATTIELLVVLIWLENGKKKNKCMEPMWVVETTPGPSSFICRLRECEMNELVNSTYRIHIARSAASSTSAPSDKKCHMHFILYSVRGLIKLVLDLGNKQLLQCEDILASVLKLYPKLSMLHDSQESITLCGVIPCPYFRYWQNTLVERDLDRLVVTGDTFRPILIQQSYPNGGVKHIDELRDLPHCSESWNEMLLVTPSEEATNALWCALRQTQAQTNPWHALTCLLKESNECSEEKQEGIMLVGLLPSASVPLGLCLLPSTNECIPIPRELMLRYSTVSDSRTSGDGKQLVLLEQVIPEPPCPTEMILRVLVDKKGVLVSVMRFEPPGVETLVTLSRECIPLDANFSDNEMVARRGKLVRCRIEKTGDAPSDYHLLCSGCSILLQLCDASLLLVDLSGTGDVTNEVPFMVHYPSALLPAGTSVASLDTAWLNSEKLLDRTNRRVASTEILALFCTLSDQKGVVVWDMCHMRLLTYFPQKDQDEWNYDNVIACAEKDNIPATAEVSEIKISISLAYDLAEKEHEGRIFLRDYFGRLLVSLCVRNGFGDLNNWSVRRDESDAEWYPLISKGVSKTSFYIKLLNGQMFISTDKDQSLGEAVAPHGRIAVVEVGDSWPFGVLQWYSCKEHEREKNMRESETLHIANKPNKKGTVLLINQNKIGFFSSTQLALDRYYSGTAVVFQCAPGRFVEQVLFCSMQRAVFVLTKDHNCWRWIYFLDLDNGNYLMDPQVMVCFTHEMHLRAFLVPTEKDNFHVYFVGGGGLLGHVSFSVAGDGDALTFITCTPLVKADFPSVPSSFQLYRNFLPRLPTMKQEQGFLKRIMTCPWEEIALSVEGKILLEERVEPFDDFFQRCKVTAGEGLQSSRERRELTPGSRYTQLKSIAEREGISFSEAHKAMSENMAKLGERGERISEIQKKSNELAQEAATFQALSQKLKEEYQRRWF